jgi:hypothetical protein
MKPKPTEGKGINYKEKIFGWQDCCPLCGNVNVKNNICNLCGFKWKKGYVYFSGHTPISYWEDGNYIDLTKMNPKSLDKKKTNKMTQPNLDKCPDDLKPQVRIENRWGEVDVQNKPKVDNKWAREKKQVENVCKNIELLKGVPVDMPDEFVGRIWDRVKNLITQTQQETLEWCLKEVVGKDEAVNVPTKIRDFSLEFGKNIRNDFRRKQRQTIKKKMGGINATN